MESEAFLTDFDFVAMTLEQRGAYLTLILYLYCNDGKCDLDIPALSQLCNKSTKTFEKIWLVISKKFQTRNGVIKHKRVTKELKRARKFRQAKSRAGLKGADKRWHSQSTAITKKRKSNVIEKEDKDSSYSNAISTEQSYTAANSVRPRPDNKDHLMAFNFNVELIKIIRPANQSDRTCFRNITNWLMVGCATGGFNHEIFIRVLDYAKEASRCRNPAAVFVTLLKKELDYRPKAAKAGLL
jgi:uncharacterized protein YdaU (DUF1376 family)